MEGTEIMWWQRAMLYQERGEQAGVRTLKILAGIALILFFLAVVVGCSSPAPEPAPVASKGVELVTWDEYVALEVRVTALEDYFYGPI